MDDEFDVEEPSASAAVVVTECDIKIEESFEPRIRPLDPDVVQKIAAGEIIHLPLNVVKELMENCIDAKSDHIIVTLKDGGYGEVMIRDNGCGIHPDDTDQIANRFHSSKIKSVAEVYKIKTLGFRGEALSSMAVVGKVTIVSKRSGQETGIRIVIQGKERTKKVEHHLDCGTTIVVSDIFKVYTPSDVKRSIYRITQLVTNYACANPGIKFILQTPAVAFRTPNLEAAATQKEWISEILGIKKLFHRTINSTNPPFSVSLFGSQLKEGKLTLKTPKTNLNCFVNRRLVTICSLEGLLKDQLERNAYTCETIVAFFEMDPSLIDVHVSPTKEMVTIRNAEAVLNIVSEDFGEMIAKRCRESQVGAEKSPRAAFASSSKESSGNFFSPSTKLRFDPNQSLMDSFINNETTAEAPSFIESEIDAELDVTEKDKQEEHLVFRKVDTVYDELIDEIRNDCNAEWTNKFKTAQSLKLRKINDTLVLMFQINSNFYFLPFNVMLEEYLYQRILLGFANFSCVKDTNDTKISLRSLILAAIPEASEEFILTKFQVLIDSRMALDDYFSITFEETEDRDLILTGVPYLLPSATIPWSNVALALVTVAEEYPNDPEANQKWIKEFAGKLAAAYSAQLYRNVEAGREAMELELWNSQIIPKIRKTYLCGSRFVGSVISGTNSDLYKCFERC